MEQENKRVIRFSIVRLIMIIIVLIGGISVVTYGKYIINKNFEVTVTSASFYFDAEAKATKTNYIKEEDKDITVEITIKNNDGTNYNEYETKYEITCENSKFTMTGTNTGSIENTKTDKKVTLQFTPKDEGQLNTTEEIILKIKSTEPYVKEITKSISIKVKEKISIGEAINAQYYGWKVKDYKMEEAEVRCWRLFYQDEDYTYLISDKILNLIQPLKNLYEEAGYGEKTGADVSEVGQGLNPMLKAKGGFSANNTYDNIKAVAYLTNPEQWQKYKNDDAEYAIAGPTIELLVESFNATVAVESDGRKRISSLVVDEGVGYNNAGTSQGHFLTSYNYGIYNHDHEDYKGAMWELGSPARKQDDGSTNRVKHVTQEYNCISDGSVNMACCVRPLVCIRTSVFKANYADSLENEK